MKMRHNIVILLIAYIIAVSCGEKTENMVINYKEASIQKIETENQLKTSVFTAARKNVPLNPDKGLGIGILYEDRTKTSCIVVYSNHNQMKKFVFTLIDGYWERRELIEQLYFEPSSIPQSLNKVTEDNWIRLAVIYGKDYSGYYYTMFELEHHEGMGSGDFMWCVTTSGQIFKAVFEENLRVWDGNYWDFTLDQMEFYLEGHEDSPKTYYTTTVENPFGTTAGADDIYIYYEADGPPNSPQLSYPNNNSSVSGLSVNFSWQSAGGTTASSYALLVTDNGQTFYNNTNITGTSQTVSGFENGKSYEWKVRASNLNGTGPWSETWSFSVPLHTPSVTGSVQSLSPRLDWQAVPGATSYKIVKFGISGSQEFTTTNTYYIDWSEAPVELSITFTFPEYYVKAVNAYGESDPSMIIVYKIVEESGGGGGFGF